MTMSQAAASLGCSKEQATRLVAALVDAGFIERLHSEENRKLVMIRLTKEGTAFVCWERMMVQEKTRREFEHEVYRKNIDGASAGGSEETEVVR